MEYRSNYNDVSKPKYSMKNLSHCLFVHHKSETKWPAIKPSSQSDRPANNCPSHGTAHYFGGVSLHNKGISELKALVLPTSVITPKCHNPHQNMLINQLRRPQWKYMILTRFTKFDFCRSLKLFFTATFNKNITKVISFPDAAFMSSDSQTLHIGSMHSKTSIISDSCLEFINPSCKILVITSTGDCIQSDTNSEKN